MRITRYLIGLFVLLLAFPTITSAESDVSCGCDELTSLELLASSETLVDAAVVSVDEVSERVAIATLDVHSVYAGSVRDRVEVILDRDDRDGGEVGPCIGTSLVGGVGVSGVMPLRRDGDHFVADRCTLAIRPERFAADLPPVDLVATGGAASVIGFGGLDDASVFALDRNGAVLAANRIEAVRAAVPCHATPYVGLLFDTPSDQPLSVGVLDIASLTVIETRTFDGLESNGELACAASGELFAGLYRDDKPTSWLRVPRGSATAVVTDELGVPGARTVSGDRVATVTNGGSTASDASSALRLTVFDFASSISRSTPLDGPPGARADDVGLSGDELAVAFTLDSDDGPIVEVWTYTLGENGAEVSTTEQVGVSPIDAGIKQQFAAFGFTESMQLVPATRVQVELATGETATVAPVEIGVDGATAIVTTPFGIAGSVDGVLTMLDTPFGRGQGWLRQAVLLDAPATVDAVSPDPVVTTPPETGTITIDEATRSQLWRSYPVFRPPRDPTLDEADDWGWEAVLIPIATIAGLAVISVFVRRRRAGRQPPRADAPVSTPS